MKFLRVGLSFVLVVSQLVILIPTDLFAQEAEVAKEADALVIADEKSNDFLTNHEAVEVQAIDEHHTEITEASQPQQLLHEDASMTLMSTALIEPVVQKPLQITEVQVSGLCDPMVCSGNNAEFVEVFNPNDTELALEGYQMVYQNSGGTQTVLADFATTTKLLPKQFALVARNITSKDVSVLVPTKTALADAAGAIFLRQAVNGTSPTVVDRVAWGSIATGFYGEKAAATPATNKSLQRCFVNGQLREYDPRSTHQEFVVYANELPTPGTGLECEKPIVAPTVNECAGLRINEIGANLTEQFVELRNVSTEPIELTGCQLQTNRSTTKSFVFANEILPAGGLRTMYIKDSSLTLTKTTSGVAYILSSDGLTEVDTQAYTNLAAGTTWSYFEDGWLQTYVPTPGVENVAQKYLPCDEGYQRSSETGRCNKIVVATILADCGEGKYRSEETGRCRSIPAASVLAACKLGQYRSEETNRCRNIVTASTQKPCKDNQYRSEETNRCRNIVASSVPSSTFAVQPVKESAMAFVGWWALGGVGLLAAAYAGWEWRSELKAVLSRAASFFSGKR